ATDGFVSAEDVFGSVVGVNVRGNEVNRDFLFDAMGDKSINPSGLRGRGAADAEALVDALYGAGGNLGKVVVGWFFGDALPEIYIRLVPHLEIPLRNFLDAVSIDEVLREVRHQVTPPVPVLRRRDDRVIPKDVNRGRLGGELTGHKAEFYVWA